MVVLIIIDKKWRHWWWCSTYVTKRWRINWYCKTKVDFLLLVMQISNNKSLLSPISEFLSEMKDMFICLNVEVKKGKKEFCKIGI